MSEEEKGRYHRERELYMCDKAMSEAAGLSNIMIICGRVHSEAIARELRERGNEVEVTDLQEQDWCVDDWISHCLKNL